VGDDPAGVGAALDYEVAQLPVVGLDVALPRAEPLALLEELAEVDAEPALCGHLVRCVRVGRNVQSRNPQLAGRSDHLDELVEDDGRVLLGRLVGVVVAVADLVRVERLVADGVDALVDLAAVCVDDLLYRVALGEVYRRRVAVLLCELQATRDAVDGVDLARALDFRAVGGHQADRAGPEDGHGVAGFEIRQFRAVPARREDVRKQRERVLVFVALRQFQRVEIRIRDAELLGLAALVRPHRDVPVGAAGEARIDVRTEPGVAVLAVLAEPARDVERRDDAVAFLECGDGVTDLRDDTHVLVPEHDTRLRCRPPLVHVQVRPADTRGRDVDDDVVRVLDLRFLYLLYRHFVLALVDDCFHCHPITLQSAIRWTPI